MDPLTVTQAVFPFHDHLEFRTSGDRLEVDHMQHKPVLHSLEPIAYELTIRVCKLQCSSVRMLHQAAQEMVSSCFGKLIFIIFIKEGVSAILTLTMTY